MKLVVSGGTVVTMDAARSVVRGDVLVEDGKIAAVGKIDAKGATRIDASGCVVLPGLVQAHTHVCQTLCRGAADDLPLLDWLQKRVWPYEARLDEAAMRACTRLAAAELLLGGTTAILDMGTVHETDALAD
jgi:cytosine/adenosine deaminase-related metal-dependent hydrolase